jgi:hypothetical protein
MYNTKDCIFHVQAINFDDSNFDCDSFPFEDYDDSDDILYFAGQADLMYFIVETKSNFWVYSKAGLNTQYPKDGYIYEEVVRDLLEEPTY